MTSTLISECKRTGICHSRFDDTPFHDGPDDEGTMVAFCSSAGRFPNVLRECEDRGLPVTVVTSAIEMPKDPKTAVINVPNLGAVTNALLKVANDATDVVAEVKRQIPESETLVSFGLVHPRFIFYYGQSIPQVPWPRTAADVPTDVTYFCCYASSVNASAEPSQARPQDHSTRALPFDWERIAVVSLALNRTGNQPVDIVVGRIVKSPALTTAVNTTDNTQQPRTFRR